MTLEAPAAMALGMSPVCFMPPSAIIGTPDSAASVAHSRIAVICGTPTPVTTRVVHIDPGPIPVLTASTPRSISARAPFAVATFPAITSTFGNRFFKVSTPSRMFLL